MTRRTLALAAFSLLGATARAGDAIEITEGDLSGPYLIKIFATAAQSNTCPTIIPFAAYCKSTGEYGVTFSIYWTGQAVTIGTAQSSTGCQQPSYFKTPVPVLSFPMMPNAPATYQDDFIFSKFVQAMARIDPKNGARGKSYRIVAEIFSSAQTGNNLGYTKVSRLPMKDFVYPDWMIFDCASDACKIDLDEATALDPPEVVLPYGDPSKGGTPGTEVEPATTSPNPMSLVESIARYLLIPPASALDELKEAVTKLVHWGPLGWIADWSADLGAASTDSGIRIGAHPYEIPLPTPYGTAILNLQPYETVIKCARLLLLALFGVRILPPLFRWVSKLI